jgi:hypothetical protein
MQPNVGAFLMLTNMDCREQVSQFKLEYSNSFGKLDSATKCILDAILNQQDVFQVAHEAQLSLIKNLCEGTKRSIDDIRQEIIREIKVTLISCLFNHLLTL